MSFDPLWQNERKQHLGLTLKEVSGFRPRGWHLEEPRIIIDGSPMSGSMFDFGLYFFHNAKELVKRGTGPYFYLPKMEHHLEARWVIVCPLLSLGMGRRALLGRD